MEGDEETEDEGCHRPPPEKVIRVDVYHHFDGPIEIDLDLGGDLTLAGALKVTVSDEPGTPVGIRLVPGIPRPNQPKE